jgi:transposase-like protein
LDADHRAAAVDALSEAGTASQVIVRRPPGRPTVYDPSYPRLAAAMCKLGATDEEVAEALGVARSTLYVWHARYPEFQEAMKLGKEPADDRVERSLYQRATGFTAKTEKVFNNQGQIIRVETEEYFPPDAAAAWKWLAARRGWTEKVTHDLAEPAARLFQEIAGRSIGPRRPLPQGDQ